MAPHSVVYPVEVMMGRWHISNTWSNLCFQKNLQFCMAVKLLACDTDSRWQTVSYEKDIWTWGEIRQINKLLDSEELYNFNSAPHMCCCGVFKCDIPLWYKQTNKDKDRIVTHISLRIISRNLLSYSFRRMWTDASTSQIWRSSRDSVVIKTIGIGAGRSGTRIPTGTEKFLETSICSPFTHLTRLLAREYFT